MRMDDSEAGPSRPKQQKTIIKDKNNLSEDEMKALLILYDSGSEDVYLSESDEWCSDASEEEESDNEPQNLGTPTRATISSGDGQNLRQRAITWQDNPVGMQKFNFSKANEILVPLPQSGKPSDYFFMLAGEDLWNLIVTETNRYAEEYFCNGDVSWKSRITLWKPLRVPELFTFIALLLHMGNIKLDKLQDYWKSDPLYDIKCFRENMGRDRFLLILRCLHFSRNPQQGEPIPEDQLYKIRPILEYFNSKMSEIYYPGRELALYESMVLRRHLIFRQYIKNKRYKEGIKLYMLTEPDGTVLKINIYPGTRHTLGEKDHATKLVMELVKEKLDNGHAIYLDNCYNSFRLSETLIKRKTYCTGMLHANRKGNSKEIVTAKLKKGETKSQYCDGIMIGKWKDKEEVLYISTEFTNEMVEYVDKRDRKKEEPQPVLEYNKHMSDINMQVEMMEYYPCFRTTLQWYKKLGVHIIQHMLSNSHFLYNKFSGKKMTLHDFRLKIIQELLKTNIKKNEKTTSKSKITEHLPTKITDLSKKGQTKRKRCRISIKEKK